MSTKFKYLTTILTTIVCLSLFTIPQTASAQGACDFNHIGQCNVCPSGQKCVSAPTLVAATCRQDPTCSQPNTSSSTGWYITTNNNSNHTTRDSGVCSQCTGNICEAGNLAIYQSSAMCQQALNNQNQQPSSGEIPADPISDHFPELVGLLAPEFSQTPSEDNFVGALIGRLLPFLLVFGGLLLLIMLISGGFQLLTNPTNPQAQEGGKQRLLYAIIGFFLLFVSYWLMQILEVIFGIKVL